MEPKATIPKTRPNETPIWIEERSNYKKKGDHTLCRETTLEVGKRRFSGSRVNNWQAHQTRGLDSQIQSQEDGVQVH